MPDHPFEAIPAERRDVARAAWRSAFGSAACSSAQPVTGGGSGALIHRIEAASRPYLLRIETATPAHGNPQRGYTCMRMAADAGIAPVPHYADASTGVAIMDFVAQRALGEFPGGLAGLARELGQLIRSTHALTMFPQFGDLESMLSSMLQAIAGSGLFSPGLLSPHLECFQRIRQAYPWREQASVSSPQSFCDVGKAFLGMFLSGLRAPGFDEALVCVAQG